MQRVTVLCIIITAITIKIFNDSDQSVNIRSKQRCGVCKQIIESPLGKNKSTYLTVQNVST